MRTVDPAQWSKKVIKPKSIFASFTCKRKLTVFESLVKDSFVDSAKELWSNSTLGGYKYLENEECTNKFVRNLYILMLFVLMSYAILTTVMTCELASKGPPTTRNRLPALDSLQHIDFPAIGLCSYNLISQTALRKYSMYLNAKDANKTYTLKEIERNLLHFGALVDMTREEVDMHFIRFMANVGGERNVTDILWKLSPNCMEMLVRCSWRAHVVPCHQIFAVRLTPHGFCCVFNTRYALVDRNTPAKKVDLVGVDSGLGLVIRENRTDFAFMRRPDDGIEVLIWDGAKYPVLEGGATMTSPAHRNSSAFITLRARVVKADRSLNDVNESWRQCRIPTSESASYSWCLLKCHEAAVSALCSCTPHSVRTLFPMEERQQDVLCSLEHLACLSQHRETLFSYHDGNSIQGDREGALHCEHCLPDCAGTRYSADVAHAPYAHLHKLFKNILSSDITFVNTTIIRIYFTKHNQKHFIAETTIRWHEMLAKLCSHWVCYVGAALTLFFKLIFHCSVRWRANFVRRRETLNAHKRLWSSLNIAQK